MSETSTLIEKLGLDKDAIYKCVRRADCSNCLCDDVRYSKCQLITSWGKFSREYPSLMALLMERLSEKMEDKDKTDWHNCRHDNKYTYFKEVEEIGEKRNASSNM